MRKIAVIYFLLAIFVCPTHSIFADSLSISGGKDKSQKTFNDAEADIDSRRSQRDYNTIKPLEPLINYVVDAMKAGEAFNNSLADSGSRAKLLCDDKKVGVETACSTSETNRECVRRLELMLAEMGHSSPSSACELPNPNDSWFKPNYIYRNGTIIIER
jgi:hypothetical protein